MLEPNPIFQHILFYEWGFSLFAGHLSEEIVKNNLSSIHEKPD